MNIELSLFYLFASIAFVSAIMVIGARNPIHSVLFLILVFCNAAGLLLLLEVEFLAMVFLIVYVGAIAVLFLFVVMMLNVKVIEFHENISRYLPIGGFIGIIFLLEILLVVDNDLIPILTTSAEMNSTLGEALPSTIILWVNKIHSLTNIEVVGQLLYTYYFYWFLVASLILLVAMIGAITLTSQKRGFVLRQDVYSQVSRELSESITFKTL